MSSYLISECSDLRMPRMDGVALTRHIISKMPNTPVVVMTAYAAQDVKGLSELGVPVLNKPLMLEQLKSPDSNRA